jgi:hypothetical protein
MLLSDKSMLALLFNLNIWVELKLKHMVSFRVSHLVKHITWHLCIWELDVLVLILIPCIYMFLFKHCMWEVPSSCVYMLHWWMRKGSREGAAKCSQGVHQGRVVLGKACSSSLVVCVSVLEETQERLRGRERGAARCSPNKMWIMFRTSYVQTSVGDYYHSSLVPTSAYVVESVLNKYACRT